MRGISVLNLNFGETKLKHFKGVFFLLALFLNFKIVRKILLLF